MTASSSFRLEVSEGDVGVCQTRGEHDGHVHAGEDAEGRSGVSAEQQAQQSLAGRSSAGRSLGSTGPVVRSAHRRRRPATGAVAG